MKFYAIRSYLHNIPIRLSIKLAGKHCDGGHGAWRWALTVRCWLSYYLGIGDVFYGWEECQRCGIDGREAEFCFERVGPRRAVCDLPCVEDGDDYLQVYPLTVNPAGEEER